MGQKIAAIFTNSALTVWQVIAAMLCLCGLSTCTSHALNFLPLHYEYAGLAV